MNQLNLKKNDMKREIKFKAKRLDNGEWVYGDLYHNVKGFDCIGQLEDNDVMVYPVDPSTICQYTGLKDCEGNELWEHDIVMATTRHLVFAKAEIVWSDKDTKFCQKVQKRMFDGILDSIRLYSKFDKEESK